MAHPVAHGVRPLAVREVPIVEKPLAGLGRSDRTGSFDESDKWACFYDS